MNFISDQAHREARLQDWKWDCRVNWKQGSV